MRLRSVLVVAAVGAGVVWWRRRDRPRSAVVEPAVTLAEEPAPGQCRRILAGVDPATACRCVLLDGHGPLCRTATGIEFGYDAGLERHALEEAGLVGGEMLLAHPRSRCEPPCPIHAPSDHHMTDWPQHWRADRRIIERLCPHGIGHPDPDTRFPAGDGPVHGCDGCCQPVP